MKQEDIDLLHLAAKEANIRLSDRRINSVDDNQDWLLKVGYDPVDADNGDGGYHIWNPLIDDGDALRLLASIGVCSFFNDYRSFTIGNSFCFITKEWLDFEDKQSTVRRAIVEFAAKTHKVKQGYK